MEYTVKIEDVTFGYGDRLILQNVSMKFGAGKVVAIRGGSGMGKTTLLKLIGGLLTPQGGRVEVTGETLDPSNQKRLYRIRRRMGMLFQFGALFTDLSVFDNVAFPMREQTDLDEETIRDLVLMKLNAVGLRGEPFAGLDPISLGVTANLIRKLNDALHSTSVIVTHDVVETFEIADYVYMINAGRVAAEGSPEELCRSEEPFVKQFINALPDGPVRFHYPANSIEACFGGEDR